MDTYPLCSAGRGGIAGRIRLDGSRAFHLIEAVTDPGFAVKHAILPAARMKTTANRHCALAIGMAMMAGCSILGRAPTPQDSRAAPSPAVVAPQSERTPTAVTSSRPAPPSVVEDRSATATSSTPPAERSRPGAAARVPPKAAVPKPPASEGRAASPSAASAPPAAPAPLRLPPPAPTIALPPATPPLDLAALEHRLRETKAISVFSKLALKNQFDDLMEQLRALPQGHLRASLNELRRSFDLLMMKALALLQDEDPLLASALASSRESIWNAISVPARHPTL